MATRGFRLQRLRKQPARLRRPQFETLERRDLLTGTKADIVFLVDESTSDQSASTKH